MRVEVENLIEKNGATYVTLASDIGVAYAKWIGEPPSIGSTCYVEIDIPNSLQWNTDVSHTLRNTPKFESVGERIELVGQLVGFEDGVATVQLGDDVMLVEVNELPLDVLNWIIIRVPEAEVYPIQI